MRDDDLELDHPSEIAALIEEAVHSQVRLHMEAPGGELLELLPLSVDRARGLLQLRLPGLQASAPAWLLNGPVHAHAMLDKVRIDFDLAEGGRQLLSESGLPLLQLPLPMRLRRHQRRQAFRVAPVSQHHPRALVPVAGQTRPLRLTTQDLSAGGVALIWPGPDTLPVPGQRLDGVELEMERELRVSLGLNVEHVRRNARGDWVVGCAFVNLAPQAERQLLLHLNQLQRRHRVISAR
jgi:c-di-GMP-binding flagellar brake protein YcgR